MSDELFDEFDFPETADTATSRRPPRRILITGGYCRDEVYVGFAYGDNALPETVVAVDGKTLRDALNSMHIGKPPMLTRRRKTKRSRAPKRRTRT